MNSPLKPPSLKNDLPLYPLLVQKVRVTSAVVPGPSGVAQVAGSSVLGPTLYVAFTQQSRTDSLLQRDREPCLVNDVNGNGLVPNYYTGRLVGSFNGLPVYDVTTQRGSIPAHATAGSASYTVNLPTADTYYAFPLTITLPYAGTYLILGKIETQGRMLISSYSTQSFGGHLRTGADASTAIAESQFATNVGIFSGDNETLWNSVATIAFVKGFSSSQLTLTLWMKINFTDLVSYMFMGDSCYLSYVEITRGGAGVADEIGQGTTLVSGATVGNILTVGPTSMLSSVTAAVLDVTLGTAAGVIADGTY